MESLLIINSTLVAVCLYFVRDFHKDFKETSKKVDKLEKDIMLLSLKMGTEVTTANEESK